jgi:hypothetical protein
MQLNLTVKFRPGAPVCGPAAQARVVCEFQVKLPEDRGGKGWGGGR